MCGIVYVHDFAGNPVNNMVLQQFDKQRLRGTQGFGLFDGQEMNMVKAASEDKILKWLVKYDSNLILFHHRYPTSTVNVARAAHPFSTKDYFGKTQYVLVHNGHISNAEDLYEKHEALGIQYNSLLEDGTFNDSEALLWDFALMSEGKQDGLEAIGGMALVCMKIVDGKLNKLYFGRNSSPLNMLRTKHGIALSSEGPGEPIDPEVLYTFNYQLKRLTSRHLHSPHYSVVRSTSQVVYSDGNYDEEYHWGRDNYTGFGQYLSKNMKKRFDRFLPKRDDLIDYDRDGNPIYPDEVDYDNACQPNQITIGEVLDNDDSDVGLTEEELEMLETFAPNEAETVDRTMEALNNSQGHFESAYWELESDYNTLVIWPMSEKVAKEMALLEHCMVYLQNDPEYINEKSVSSIWEEEDASWRNVVNSLSQTSN